MTLKQRSITTLAILITLVPLTGLPIAWKSAMTVIFGLLITGVAISDWVMLTWRDRGGAFSLPKSTETGPTIPEEKTKPTSKPPVATPKAQPVPKISSQTLATDTTVPTVPVYTWPTETSQTNDGDVNSG